MGYKFVDIGDVESLKCVKSAAEGTCAEVVAEGPKGSIRFRLLHAYSRGCARGTLPNGEQVEWLDIRFLAFLRQLHNLDSACARAMIDNLKEGDVISLPDKQKAWKILKALPYGMLGYATDDNEWVDGEGCPVPEPESFRRECALTEIYQALDESDSAAAGGGEDEYEKLLDILKRYDSAPISDGDFNFMMDWYEMTATAVRTINHHCDLKDYCPNMGKIDKCLAFFNVNCKRMENLVVRCEYARHLWQRKTQIEHSRANEWKTGVEIVEVYRRGRFGEM